MSLTRTFTQHQVAVKIDGLVMWEALAGASQSLLQHRKSGYFLEPVDPVALGLNDYRDVVRGLRLIVHYNMTCCRSKNLATWEPFVREFSARVLQRCSRSAFVPLSF